MERPSGNSLDLYSQPRLFTSRCQTEIYAVSIELCLMGNFKWNWIHQFITLCYLCQHAPEIWTKIMFFFFVCLILSCFHLVSTSPTSTSAT